MDEVIIDERKYISAKQAAKVTGYARDYVGQLCREGRVKARLVGRAWYVLESAIQDHRFGPTKSAEAQQVSVTSNENEESGASHAWAPSTYAPVVPDTLPELAPKVVTEPRLTYIDGTAESSVIDVDQAQHLNNEEETQTPDNSVVADDRSEIVREVTPDARRDRVVDGIVPLDRDSNSSDATQAPQERQLRRSSRGVAAVLSYVIGVALALSFAVLAVLNSGLVDQYIYSAIPVHYISGIIVYIK
ncbi:hypothetical protein COU19_02080 [Candidatus Kaiserbacteria bacterium CG10_big_fil_rev_8_21_14_0_10_56_12]|uniref:Helix-turn-helix domain-containing protein n=1 Tax=Candidatus Kaiserbacteria bacterium CG10_big_fil_rev_8_21_14_0_10_56_12 TaxID=1974611 RepID=A0A2H0U9P0_9BACT|nr:MAG: hypothetical protein COU19_02080 [Candidatus Kaiserbacteria bacterium CG10_big_fil_rev_8_21_14_0_10_56_12]